MAESADKGCVQNDCSYRPEYGSEEWFRIQKNRVAAWANSPEGQAELIKTAKSVEAILDELKESRRLDPELLRKPMTI